VWSVPTGRTWRSRARTAPAVRAVAVRLGRRVKEVRLGKKLTQEELAERALLDDKHLAVIERGGTNPTLASLIWVARGLGVSLAELFEGV
jgi:transcriptional regulator with XRE-family HTH domain